MASSIRIGGVDRVRALAAISVMLAHIATPVVAALLSLLSPVSTDSQSYAAYVFTGHPAVVAFFVVSGFCIHYPYVQAPLRVLPFLVARLIRILVPAVVAIAVARIVRLEGFNFVDGYILWSIVCELFYYMFYPCFSFLSRWIPWRIQFYISLFISLTLAILMGSDQYGNAHVYGPWLNWIIALPSWIAGCVLAETLHFRRQSFELPSAKAILTWRVGMALSASVLTWATVNTSFGNYITMNAFALAVFFWIRTEILGANRLSSKLDFFGKWSYSIYLVHMPFAVFCFWLMKNQLTPPIGNLVAILVVLMMCWLFYMFIESPSHRLARLVFDNLQSKVGWSVAPSSDAASKSAGVLH